MSTLTRSVADPQAFPIGLIVGVLVAVAVILELIG